MNPAPARTRLLGKWPVGKDPKDVDGLSESIADSPAEDPIDLERQVVSVDDQWMDFSPDELREFLAADLVEVEADPEFRESLRQKLWRFVRSRYGRGGGEDA